VTPEELAQAEDAEDQRRVLARRIAADRIKEQGLPADEAMAAALRQCDERWPALAKLIDRYARREPPC
jgi:hypothetical protein